MRLVNCGSRRLRSFFLVGLLVQIAPLAARADWAVTSYNGGSYVSFLYAGGQTQSVGLGNFNTTVFSDQAGANTIRQATTYCIDLFVHYSSPPAIQAANYTPSTSGIVTDSSGYNRNLGAAGWILNTYGGLATSTLAAIQTFAGGGLTAGLSFGPALQAQATAQAQIVAALQLAIWKAAYVPAAATLNRVGDAVNFSPNNSNVTALANRMLASRGSQTAPAAFIDYRPFVGSNTGSPRNQDMLGTPVVFSVLDEPPGPHAPEPATLISMLMGLLLPAALGARRWLHRSRPATA